MTPAEFTNDRKANARTLLPLVEEEWYRAATAGGKPDDLRRLTEYFARVTGLLDTDRAPPLATVNVQFINGGVGVSRAPELEVVQRVQDGDAQDGAFEMDGYNARASGLTVMADVESILKGLL